MPEAFKSDNTLLSEFLKTVDGSGAGTECERAVRVYYAIRDEIRYNPFDIRLEAAELKPEICLAKKSGHCIDKAMLFVAACRKMGIPAKLGIARVRNHLSTEPLEVLLGTNVLVPHGYAACLIDGKWSKCTPAFNRSLCEKLGVEPLEWNGTYDSLFQEVNRDGTRFMEYLEDYGLFDELPIDLVVELMQREYPRQFDAQGNWIPIS